MKETITVDKHVYEQMQAELISLRDRVKKLEDAYQKTEAQDVKCQTCNLSHNFADNVPGIIYNFQIQPNGNISFPYVSSGCQSIWEVSPEVVQQNPDILFDMIYPDDAAILQKIFIESAQNFQTWECEFRITTPSGKQKWLQSFSKPEKNTDGYIVWYGCIVDITQRKVTEANLRTIFDSVYDAIFIHDLDGNIIDVNQKMLQMYGVNYQEAINLSIATDYSSPDNPFEELPEIWRTVIAGKSKLFEWKAKHYTSGKIFDVEIFLRRINLNGRDLILANIRDISEYKQAEFKLKELNQELELRVRKRTQQLVDTELRLTRLTDNVPGMIYEFCLQADGNKSFNYVSDGCKLLWEIEPQQALENSDMLFELIHPQDIALVNQKIVDSAQTLQKWECEWRIITDSGKAKWLKGISEPRMEEDNSIIWCGCVIDITKEKISQEQVEQQQLFLQSIWEGVDYGIFVLEVLEAGKEFRFVDFNPAMAKNAPMAMASMLGKTVTEALPVEMAAIYNQRYRDCVTKGKTQYFEETFELNDIQTWWLIAVTPMRDIQNRIYKLIVTTTDITQRKQIELELSQKEEQYRHIFENVSDGLLINDLETGLLVKANPVACDMHGYSPSEFIGLHPTVFIDSDYHYLFQQFSQEIQQGKKFYAQAVDVRKDGSKLDVEIKGTSCTYNGKLHGLTVVRDISERKRNEIKLQKQTQELKKALGTLKRTQAQLVQSEKMSSIGQMVAGVAHEINNPTNFIHGNISPAIQYVEDLLKLLGLYQNCYPHPPEEIAAFIEDIELYFIQEDVIKLLESMQEGTRRIREIILSLRNFSRLDESEYKEVNIHSGIDSTLMILQNRLKEKPNSPEIEVIKKYALLPLVKCYPGQLNQVVMNILVNSIDALDEYNQKRSIESINNKPSQIKISTELISEQLSEQWIAIRIADNGLGIPQAFISKLFDPFFTTKDVGQGTGLGLSISYQIIVEKHGGKLYCNSKIGKGAEFVIEIPVSGR
ncbi:PAS domain S-box [Rivularia sp. PCC 7116]|uniref:PAS domain S-box protein n=1 Tax=Rivularia sp. PCC 7116 TaxID=373994 RepID=UPI00029F3722|nr:PAS domain S-box protein [Rivularia sp. PCC 7116]AFY58103.1 PAS domain S-box [Rivularia sp. PCC 7116]